MFRAAYLIFCNEFRLLVKDRVGLSMLLLAPVVIIAVAGFSLGNLYGTRTYAHPYSIPVVDQDGGAVARAIIAALGRDPAVRVVTVRDVAQARDIVLHRYRAPLAVLIPTGTTVAIEQGRPVQLTVFVDPIDRVEASAIELRLAKLCEQVNAQAQRNARRTLSSQGADLRARLDRISGALAALKSRLIRYQSELARGRADADRELRARLRKTIGDLEAQTRVAAARSSAAAREALERKMAPRRAALIAVDRYLRALQASEHDFELWFAALKARAGSRAGEIPPPPKWPAPPTGAEIAELSKPIDLSFAIAPEPPPVLPADIAIRLPKLKPLPDFAIASALGALPAGLSTTALPGNLGWRELSLSGGSARVNAFDQYVPGFGITFLLIGMLMGISLGLIDDRDWGTLQRLRVSGAPLTATLLGKLLSRFVVGLIQMIVLFAVGWWWFGISLGQRPSALLLPAAAISFAAAAFSLVIACIARTHDSVMPFGAVVSMALSAVGGCWWPLDFEPPWLREVALWLPTTWTMQAFNDLMIRHSPPASVLWPSVITVGLGLIYLAVGLAGASRLYEQ